jgi:hypothetical protein
MTESTFPCAMCGQRFPYNPDWTDEDAREEAAANGFDVEECELVCDVCYRLTPWGAGDPFPREIADDDRS